MKEYPLRSSRLQRLKAAEMYVKFILEKSLERGDDCKVDIGLPMLWSTDGPDPLANVRETRAPRGCAMLLLPDIV